MSNAQQVTRELRGPKIVPRDEQYEAKFKRICERYYARRKGKVNAVSRPHCSS